MRKMTRIVFIAAILVITAGVVFLNAYVKPILKTMLVQKASLYLGRPVVVEDLGFILLPSPGIKLKGFVIDRLMSTRCFAKGKELQLRLKWWPLLNGHLKPDAILIKDMLLHIENNKKAYDLKHVEFYARNIHSSIPFPMLTEFDFTSTEGDVAGHALIKASLEMGLEEKTYTLHDFLLTSRVSTNDVKDQSVNIIGEIAYEREHLHGSELEGNIANLPFTGEFNAINVMNKPDVTMKIHWDDFNLSSFNAENSILHALRAAKQVDATIHVETNNKQMELHSAWKADELKINGMRLQHVTSDVTYLNNVLSIENFTASFYDGTLKLQAILDHNEDTPKASLSLHLNKAQVAWGDDEQPPTTRNIHLCSLVNADIDVASKGQTDAIWLQNLHGTMRVNFKNTTLTGFDVDHFISQGNETIKSNQSLQQSFINNITATSVIRGGVINNDMLSFNTQRFAAVGHGKLDFLRNTIAYKLNIKEFSKNQNTNPVSISIRGDLKHSIIRHSS